MRFYFGLWVALLNNVKQTSVVNNDLVFYDKKGYSRDPEHLFFFSLFVFAQDIFCLETASWIATYIYVA